VLANELRGRKVTVNAVAPGPIATELFLNGKTENQSLNSRRCRPWRGLGSRGTLRTWSRSSQGRTVVGSTPKCYARTAALPTEARKVQ
jgi:NAD(P)-dependent dehydrogenase (short-subunit alcohol dehydrogenase family)